MSSNLSEPSDSSSRVSHAGDTNFRDEVLPWAKIFFHEDTAMTPPTASDLIALLSHWPMSYNLLGKETDITDSSNLSEEEERELRAAVDSARPLHPSIVQATEGRTKPLWIRRISNVVLGGFIKAHDNGSLSGTVEDVWPRGPNPASLYNPKPDMAFGLGFEEAGPLSWKVLAELSNAPTIKLVVSPTESSTSITYPSLIYEAKSDSGILRQAENQAAVGAARALGLLTDLSEISGVPFQHCVVVLANSGAVWNVFVAYQDADFEKAVVSNQQLANWTSPVLIPLQHLVPVLERQLIITTFNERLRLMFIVNRILRWIQGPYRSKVAEQVDHLWRYLNDPPVEQVAP